MKHPAQLSPRAVNRLQADMTGAPVVTDHAVLRYLERACGLDVEALRRAIGKALAAGVEHGAPIVKVDGVRFVLEGPVAVTALTLTMSLSHTRIAALMGAEADDG